MEPKPNTYKGLVILTLMGLFPSLLACDRNVALISTSDGKSHSKTSRHGFADPIRSATGSQTVDSQLIVGAIKNHLFPELRALLLHAKQLDFITEEGVTLTGLAIKEKNYPALQALLEAGADANAIDKHGNRPLHYAVEQADCLQIGLLLAAGANCRLTNQVGKSAADLLQGKLDASVEITPEMFKQECHKQLKQFIDTALVELPKMASMVRLDLDNAQALMQQGSHGFPSREALRQSTTVYRNQISSDIFVWGGTDVDDLPTTQRGRYPSFRESRPMKIDLTPSPLEYEQLRKIEQETSEIYRSTAQEMMDSANRHLGFILERSLWVLMSADVLWGADHPKYQRVSEKVAAIVSGRARPPQRFDPNAFRKPGFQSSSTGIHIYSPPITGW